MAPQQQIQGEDHDDREQPLHEHARYEKIVGQRVAYLSPLAGFIEGFLVALLLGGLDALGRGPATPQQREDCQRHARQNGDLAERVEAPAIDQDNIDSTEAHTAELQSLIPISYA